MRHSDNKPLVKGVADFADKSCVAPTPEPTTATLSLIARLPEAVRFVLLAAAIILAAAAALAPLVYLLRRLGVG